MDAKSVVRTPSPAGKLRSFAASRTSARTTRNRCPVARSISSPLSASMRLTDAPTVPYPRRATPTSTDPMRLLAEEPFDPGELPQLLSHPFDLGGRLFAPRAHAVVDDADPAREVAVLGDVGHRVAHVLVAALVEQVDDQLQLVQAFVVRNL